MGPSWKGAGDMKHVKSKVAAVFTREKESGVSKGGTSEI